MVSVVNVDEHAGVDHGSAIAALGCLLAFYAHWLHVVSLVIRYLDGDDLAVWNKV